MQKHLLKYCIDAALFIDMCAIAVLGLLLAFVIPHGEGLRGAATFLGLHRHTWADIHLYFSLLLLGLLGLHLWLNWTWIAQSTQRYFGPRWKNALWAFAGASLLLLLVAWIAAH